MPSDYELGILDRVNQFLEGLVELTATIRFADVSPPPPYLDMPALKLNRGYQLRHTGENGRCEVTLEGTWFVVSAEELEELERGRLPIGFTSFGRRAQVADIKRDAVVVAARPWVDDEPESLELQEDDRVRILRSGKRTDGIWAYGTQTHSRLGYFPISECRKIEAWHVGASTYEVEAFDGPTRNKRLIRLSFDGELEPSRPLWDGGYAPAKTAITALLRDTRGMPPNLVMAVTDDLLPERRMLRWFVTWTEYPPEGKPYWRELVIFTPAFICPREPAVQYHGRHASLPAIRDGPRVAEWSGRHRLRALGRAEERDRHYER